LYTKPPLPGLITQVVQFIDHLLMMDSMTEIVIIYLVGMILGWIVKSTWDWGGLERCAGWEYLVQLICNMQLMHTEVEHHTQLHERHSLI